MLKRNKARIQYLEKLRAEAYTDCKLVRFPIQGDKVPDKL